jgi:crotonobetainyl-CoA:carnitine CoA-transferase CaiB-like acyl-CoA transferase
VRVGVPVIDIMTGMYAAIAICAALAGRAATGRGQRLDVALLDTALALLAVPAMGYLASGSPPQRIGNSHPTIVPYGVFPTRDGQLVLACGNDNLFRRFCEAAGRPELAGHPSFRSNSDRVCHRTELEAQLRGLMGAAPTSHWVAVLEKAGVPCAPILSVAQALQLPQVAHRRVVQDLVHPLAGTVPNIASPMRFSGMPVVHDRPAPTLGQHTRTVLREQLNLSDGELQTLADAGVI